MKFFDLRAFVRLFASSFCLAVVSTLAFAAKERPLVGLSLDTLKEERWQRDRDAFTAAVEQLGGKVIVQSANSDDTRQMRDIESLISRGVDVLVIAPHNGEALSRAIKSAKDAHIPVLCYDRLILNSDVDGYICFDNDQVGVTQAAYAVEHLPKDRKLRLVRVQGAPTDHNSRLYKEGQDRVLAPLIQAGRVEIVFEDWALDWKPENAKKIVNAAITKIGHDFDAVIAANDGTAGGAIQALVEEGLAGKILVTGQDAELAACQRIVRGTQTMTIYKPLPKLAEAAARTAIDLAQGRPLAASGTFDNGFKKVAALVLPVIAVDKDNLAATVVADGFHSAAQLK